MGRRPKGKPPVEPPAQLYSTQLLSKAQVAPEIPDQDFRTQLQIYKDDPTIQAAIDMQMDHVMSEGYTLEPANDEWDADVHLSRVLRETVQQLLMYGNCFIEKTYNPVFHEGKDPGIRIIPPWILEPNRDPTGMLDAWKETRTSKLWPLKKVAFLRYNVPDGGTWGIGQIRGVYQYAWKKKQIAEQLYNIHYQFAQPILAVVAAAEAKSISEADMKKVINNIEQMLSQGKNIVGIPKAVDLQIIGAERKIPDETIKFITQVYDKEICVGMRVPIELLVTGQGSTEAASKVSLAALNRHTKSIHQIIEEGFNTQILSEFPPYSELKFNEPKEPSWEAGVPEKMGKGGSPQQLGKPKQEATDQFVPLEKQATQTTAQ
jgi:hypothetical protein